MRVKFHLLDHKVTLLATQPLPLGKVKMVTASDASKPIVWEADFLHPEVEIKQIGDLQGHSYNVKVLSWSPKGSYFISACDVPILWKDEGKSLKKLTKLHQEESEVHSVNWSADEKRVLIGSQNNYLHLHNIETQTLIKKVNLDNIPSGVCWDPLDSYIAVLTTENCVFIYTSNNLEFKKKVSFNIGSKKFSDMNSKKIERRIDWSPDGEFCICPSLEDKTELPIACAINRTRDWTISNVFAGPTGAITCISFLDCVFRKDKEYYSVFAMGDSDGNISLWQTKGLDKPICYIKGGYDDMSIETICWNMKAQMLVASTTKKFIMLIQYDPTVFGTMLSDSERKQYMETLYGKHSSIAGGTLTYLDQRMLEQQKAMQNQSMPEFKDSVSGGLESRLGSMNPNTIVTVPNLPGGSSDVKKMEVKRNKPSNTNPTPSSIIPEKEKDNKDKVVDEREEQKADSNGEKKDGENKEKSSKRQRPSSQSLEAQAQIEKICFPKLNRGLDNFKITLMDNKILVIRTEKRVQESSEVTFSKISCLATFGNNMNETLWTDYVEGKVLNVEYNSKYLIYYTDGHLLHLNNITTGKKIELPLMIPNLARMKLNSGNYLLLIKENGDLRVYNFEEKKIILDENCYSLIKELNPGNPPTAENIYLDDNGIPYICIKPNLVILYQKDLKAWQKVDSGVFNFGIFKNIPKPFRNNQSPLTIINRTPKDKFEEFMKEIAGGEVNPEKIKYDNRMTVIRHIEEAMIYAINTGDMRAYYELSGLYIRKLADFHEFNKIRCFIIEDLLKNNNSKDYQFIRSKLKDKEGFHKFVTHLKMQLNTNQESVINLRKEIENVLENLVYDTIFAE